MVVDGTEAGEHALKQAITLAGNEKSSILAVYVFPDYRGDLELVGVNDIDSLIKGRGDQVQTRVQKIAMEERGLRVRLYLETGEPFTVISELAETEKCDLIVIGRSDGDSGANRIFFSSVISRVIGYSGVNVMVIPIGAELNWHRILLCTDGSRGSRGAVNQARKFALAYGDRVDIVHVVKVNEEYQALAPRGIMKLAEQAVGKLTEISREFGADGVETRVLVKEGEPVDIITSLARNEKVDAVIMGSHGRSELKRLLMGSITEGVLALSVCPVLVVHSGS